VSSSAPEPTEPAEPTGPARDDEPLASPDAGSDGGGRRARGEDDRPDGGYPPGTLDVRRLGRVPYQEAYALQQDLVARRLAGTWGDTLLLCEHDPVVTLGRGTPRASVPELDVPVVEVERGGEATYHGPGQLVGYPILQLAEGARDLHAYLRNLEEVLIRTLAEVGITGSRRPGLTGVWVDERKIGSIGIAVRRWVTWHGFALNLNTDLDAFRAFRPCGLDPAVMTRVADLTDEMPPSHVLFEVLVVKHFLEVFDLDLPPIPQRAVPSEPPEGAGPGFLPLPLHP
jgi:lipoate-protein ligase B